MSYTSAALTSTSENIEFTAFGSLWSAIGRTSRRVPLFPPSLTQLSQRQVVNGTGGG
jgi:hypothetical protein